MQFFRDKNVYKVTRMAGPSHNLLGLSFDDQAGENKVVIQSVASARNQPERIVAAEVRQHVLNGIREANNKLGTAYRVREIQFLPSDSPPSNVYHFLAMTIVERLHQKGLFKQLQ